MTALLPVSLSLWPLTSVLTPEWQPAALLIEHWDKLENNNTTEEEWCQVSQTATTTMKTQICFTIHSVLHRQTVEREGGSVRIYCLFRESCGHQRDDKKQDTGVDITALHLSREQLTSATQEHLFHSFIDTFDFSHYKPPEQKVNSASLCLKWHGLKSQNLSFLEVVSTTGWPTVDLYRLWGR